MNFIRRKFHFFHKYIEESEIHSIKNEGDFLYTYWICRCGKEKNHKLYQQVIRIEEDGKRFADINILKHEYLLWFLAKLKQKNTEECPKK